MRRQGQKDLDLIVIGILPGLSFLSRKRRMKPDKSELTECGGRSPGASLQKHNKQVLVYLTAPHSDFSMTLFSCPVVFPVLSNKDAPYCIYTCPLSSETRTLTGGWTSAAHRSVQEDMMLLRNIKAHFIPSKRSTGKKRGKERRWRKRPGRMIRLTLLKHLCVCMSRETASERITAPSQNSSHTLILILIRFTAAWIWGPFIPPSVPHTR